MQRDDSRSPVSIPVGHLLIWRDDLSTLSLPKERTKERIRERVNVLVATITRPGSSQEVSQRVDMITR